ncbi:MAG: low-specificity L-threonine aldolase [Chloroflexi bacterium]|nr:low-specificity L-threonine aldolase [Chloroflexota bacterium]
MDRIDFRSDTVSWPTPTMREAMAQAKVGDDVYGEDPTVRELEALAAEMTGKEAALFVASGTMGNLVAILAHAGRGDEAIVGEDSHTCLYEAGGMAALGGVFPRMLPTDEMGQMDLGRIETAVSPPDSHFPRTRLILVENSYGSKHGYPLPPAYFAQVRAIADRHGLAVHMDGARLFNAAVAQNIPATAVTQYVDSVTFCLSKGLCAPVGSVLCGSAEFMQQAHRMRKTVGGGMRQAGILAAAGLVSLRQMVERLADDHRRAQDLAQGLAQIPGISVQPEMVKTNMVFFALSDEVPLTADDVIAALRQRANVWLGDNGRRSFRAVTHYWISDQDIETFLATLQQIVTE